MIQEGFESVYNAINTPFLENSALVGKRDISECCEHTSR